jgi:hypothetical protein
MSSEIEAAGSLAEAAIVAHVMDGEDSQTRKDHASGGECLSS